MQCWGLGPASAQTLISIQTDDIRYEEGDVIAISGKVQTRLPGEDVQIQILYGDILIDIYQIVVAQDGSFSETVKAERPLWRQTGEYDVRAQYGEEVVSTSFVYSPKRDIPVISDNYEVKAGTQGTFDVQYTISGSEVQTMHIDPNMLSLLIRITPSEEGGTVTLKIPAKYVDAMDGDGNDIAFIVLVDGTEITPVETADHAVPKTRSITFDFRAGSTDIAVIGTHILPEFGAAVALILVAGTVAVIAAARSRIMPRTV